MALSRPANSEQQPFRFLDLLPELRNNIYRHTLVKVQHPPCRYTMVGNPLWCAGGHAMEGEICCCEHYQEPALLRVCRQIRFEAQSIFLAEIEFYAHDSEAVIDFVTAIPDTQAQHLKNLKIEPEDFASNGDSEELYDMAVRQLAEVKNALRGKGVADDVVKMPLVLGQNGIVDVSAADIDDFKLVLVSSGSDPDPVIEYEVVRKAKPSAR